jgi:hypothetical protein
VIEGAPQDSLKSIVFVETGNSRVEDFKLPANGRNTQKRLRRLVYDRMMRTVGRILSETRGIEAIEH